mmetsp:Transcript_43087/g.99816  ORF Transcript_43087/g.99816 Transcript_43087/m.99816 type:complete len:113 (+) Transcript_43087:671-1009(+)
MVAGSVVGLAVEMEEVTAVETEAGWVTMAAVSAALMMHTRKKRGNLDALYTPCDLFTRRSRSQTCRSSQTHATTATAASLPPEILDFKFIGASAHPPNSGGGGGRTRGHVCS